MPKIPQVNAHLIAVGNIRGYNPDRLTEALTYFLRMEGFQFKTDIINAHGKKDRRFIIPQQKFSPAEKDIWPDIFVHHQMLPPDRWTAGLASDPSLQEYADTKRMALFVGKKLRNNYGTQDLISLTKNFEGLLDHLLRRKAVHADALRMVYTNDGRIIPSPRGFEDVLPQRLVA